MSKLLGQGANLTPISEAKIKAFGKMALTGDMVVLANHCSFCHLEPKRRVATLGGDHDASRAMPVQFQLFKV